MVRAVDSSTSNYLNAGKGVIPRSFVWIKAKNRDTGAAEHIGFWNGLDSVDATVIDGVSGLPVTRTYHAAGSLLSVGTITRTPELEVRTVRVGLSQISDAVQLLVRGYDVRHAPIEIHEGYLDLETRKLVGDAIIDFVGWVNGAPIDTPAVGQNGGIQVECVSHSRMLTRTNPAKKSHEAQKRRSGDKYRQYNTVAGQWQYWWGEREGETMG
jgi:hypothetical protein